MQKLRSTFKRCKVPSASDIKTQNSLEIPKQVRSASFDELQFHSRTRSESSGSNPKSCSSASDINNSAVISGVSDSSNSNDDDLPVSNEIDCRSKSVDCGGGGGGGSVDDDNGVFLEVPRRFSTKKKSLSSNSSTSGSMYFLNNCVHCQYLEELNRSLNSSTEDLFGTTESPCLSEDTSSSEYDDDCSQKLNKIAPHVKDRMSTATYLSPHTFDYYDRHTLEHLPIEKLPSPVRRKSICRQEALLLDPTAAAAATTSTSIENVSDDIGSGNVSAEDGLLSEGDTTVVHGTVVRDFYLTVPDLKRDRAVSVDSSFSKVSNTYKTTEQYFGSNLEVPVTCRSRSVDIVLPTPDQCRYKALAFSNAIVHKETERANDEVIDSSNLIKYVPDWNDNALNGDHLWTPTSASGDFCYANDHECSKQGPRLKCPACNIVVHQTCIPLIRDRMKFMCKSTFRDVGIRQYREKTRIYHHWVHRRSEQGKCKKCGKSKLSFSCKEIVAISCSWCKASYHNKEACFTSQKIDEECNLGVQKSIIVPPSWIIKLPKRGNFKSSLRDSSRKKPIVHKKKFKDKDKEMKTFTIKAIPTVTVTPLLVFINPKSGGNQGVKLLQKLQWLLNPRQVFDLSQGGPKMGLELFRKVPNLRILACGGDGTVGWILSVLDQINISPAPAVGVLPLGTGNDLARALGWGGGYTDEPVSKILTNISNSNIVYLDRWQLSVEKNTEYQENADGKENLPLNVVNNYFSMGVDAHIALEFHEAREAHPEKFNSRLKNKMFYGQMGGKDLLKRKWKGLAEFVTLECDGKDLTPKLKEHKVHAIVFLNIQSYGGGTKPWNKTSNFAEPTTDDQLIEVVGLTTYQLPLLQAGGHGTSLAQCKEARIVTTKTIPMQVDGEACKVNPSIITLKFLNSAAMLSKRKGAKKNTLTKLEDININVYCLTMSNYDRYHYEKEALMETANKIGQLQINPILDLEQIRIEINKLCEHSEDFLKLSNSEWCFVDCCTAERFFRIDRSQEQLHYVSDISADNLYILDTADSYCTMSQNPETLDRQQILSSSSKSSQSKDCPNELQIIDESNLDSPSDYPPVSPKSPLSPDDETFVGDDFAGPITMMMTTTPPPPHSSSTNFDDNLQNSHVLNSLTDQSAKSSSLRVSSKSSDGVLMAAKNGDLATIKQLHSQGYSLVYVDSSGGTALHYAARLGHMDIVKFLLSFAPKSIIDMKDNNLQTALHKAAMEKRRTICCVLIAAGANTELQDIEGLTPHMLAIKAEDHELASYLQSQEHFQKMVKKSATTI